jgi:hypothetical protein
VSKHVQLKGSVGKGGDNYSWDVFKVQYDLIQLVANKQMIVGKPLFPHGKCDAATIEAIILFQVRYGIKPPNGRIDPNSLATQTLYEERGYSSEKKPPAWKYQCSTGWSIGLGAFGVQIGGSRMNLFVADTNDSSSKFTVVCTGMQLSAGFGLSPSPLGSGVERSAGSHPSTGGRIKRMPRGNDPILPSDFEGVVLLDAASAVSGPIDMTMNYPNKGTFGIVRTFSGSQLPAVLAALAVTTGGAASPTTSALVLRARRQLDRIARTKGWIAGGSTVFATDAASVEGMVALFSSKVEAD